MDTDRVIPECGSSPRSYFLGRYLSDDPLVPVNTVSGRSPVQRTECTRYQPGRRLPRVTVGRFRTSLSCWQVDDERPGTLVHSQYGQFTVNPKRRETVERRGIGLRNLPCCRHSSSLNFSFFWHERSEKRPRVDPVRGRPVSLKFNILSNLTLQSRLL